MILKRIGPFSCAKVSAVLYAILGLIIGLVFSLIALAGAFASDSPAAALFGVGAVIMFPILYGCIGFISGALSAWLYNRVVGWIGGIEVEFDQGSIAPQDPSTAA
ncbi:MAG: hypothetical protein KKG33_11160 [candidate division Zixibacteria bacterium]|nr:hypothetical protein [candidate division Zixibacteria bacterium]MBU1471930.1 hypothetical protein [candidate division Zixibacteria bacterium]MBU2626107.1 hypothetical protein [candidate division Zixibacteria bacterium]